MGHTHASYTKGKLYRYSAALQWCRTCCTGVKESSSQLARHHRCHSSGRYKLVDVATQWQSSGDKAATQRHGNDVDEQTTAASALTSIMTLSSFPVQRLQCAVTAKNNGWGRGSHSYVEFCSCFPRSHNPSLFAGGKVYSTLHLGTLL